MSMRNKRLHFTVFMDKSISSTKSEYEEDRWESDSELLWPIAEDDNEPISRSDFNSEVIIKPVNFSPESRSGTNTAKALPRLLVGPDGEIAQFDDEVVAGEDDETEIMEFALDSDFQNTSAANYDPMKITEMENDTNFESDIPEWHQENYSSNYTDIISNTSTNTTMSWYQSVKGIILLFVN